MALVLDLAFDPRWRRLHDPAHVCRACGQRHAGLPTLDLYKPFQWQGGERQDPRRDDIDPRNYLLEDFCVIDNRQFFIRAVLVLPILGGGGKQMAFSLWTALGAADFDRYGESFDAPDQSTLGAMPGRIANRLRGVPDTLGLPCAVRPQRGDARPLVTLDAPGHPLAEAQQHGLAFEKALDLYAGMGHDLRPGLTVVN